jgi:hypothetical protein
MVMRESVSKPTVKAWTEMRVKERVSLMADSIAGVPACQDVDLIRKPRAHYCIGCVFALDALVALPLAV